MICSPRAQHHLAAAAYASDMLPFEMFLLAMLLEEHKELLRLREVVLSHEKEHQRTERLVD
jgi:hypothetical protein